MKYTYFFSILSLSLCFCHYSFALDEVRIRYKTTRIITVKEVMEEFLKDSLSEKQKTQAIAEAKLLYNGRKVTGFNFLIPTGNTIEFKIKKELVDSIKIRLYYLSLLPKRSPPPPELISTPKIAKKLSPATKPSPFTLSYSYIQVAMETITESLSLINFSIHRAALSYLYTYNYNTNFKLDIAGLVNSIPEVQIQGTTQEVPLQQYGWETGGQINYKIYPALTLNSSIRRMRYILGREQTNAAQSFVDTYVYKWDMGASIMLRYPLGIFGNAATFLNSTIKGVEVQNGNSFSGGAFYFFGRYSVTGLFSKTQVNTNYGSNDSNAWALTLGYSF